MSDISRHEAEPLLQSRVLVYLSLLSILPLFAITFGSGNQVEQFSIVERILNPEFAPNDFFLNDAAALGRPRYYYALMLAAITVVIPLHITIHLLTVLTGFVLGFSTYLAARRLLSASVIGGLLAATLAVLNHGFSLGYAGYLTFESYQPANIATAAVIAGIVFLMVDRIWAGAAAISFSALMHPTIGAEIGVIAYGSIFVTALFTGQRHRLLPLFLSGLVFITLLFIAWAVPNIGGNDVKLSNSEFFAILVEFRAPHHYLGLELGKRRWLEALLFLASTVFVFGYAWHRGLHHRHLLALFLMFVVVAFLCALSLYFVDVAESRLWATAQVLRNLLLIKWIGFLLFGWLMAIWLDRREPALIVLAAVMLLPGLDALSYALFVALATWVVISILGLSGLVAIAATVPAVLLAVYHMDRFGAADQTVRIAVALVALFLISLKPRPLGLAAATIAVLGFLAIAFQERTEGLFGRPVFQGGLTFADLTDDASDISRRAQSIGSEDAVWLVPPTLEQFRYLAGRAVVVDFKSVPFTDGGLRQWRDRMANLFGPSTSSGFDALREMSNHHREDPQLALAGEKYGARYAVIHVETPWNGEVLAENGSFRIVPIAP